MGIKNFQNYRLSGSSFRFQRDTVGTTKYPWIDVGTMDPASPENAPEEVIVKDGSSGILREVDRALVDISESYNVVVKNLNLENLSLLYLGERPQAFTQAAGSSTVALTGFLGHLFQVVDAAGDPLFMLSAISGAYYGGTVTALTDLTAINATLKTLTFTGDPGTSAADLFIVETDGLTDLANAKTYTQVGSVAGAGPYVVTVAETPSSSETSLTGTSVLIEGTGTIVPSAMMEVVSLNAGTGRFLAGAGFTDEADVTVVYSTAAVSGKRLIEPQNIAGTIEGVGIFTWAEGNNASNLIRRARVAITPAGATFQQTGDVSQMTLKVSVLNDLTETIPAGILLQAKGDLPATS